VRPLVFSSLLFLFLYLPVVLAVYYVTPLRWRNGMLLIANLVFYGWGEPTYIVLMVFTIVADYIAGRFVARFKSQGRDGPARAAVAAAVNLDQGRPFDTGLRELLGQAGILDPNQPYTARVAPAAG